jgi:hypothetical protein
MVASTLAKVEGNVLAALELPHEDQRLIDDYLGGRDNAREHLVASAFWAKTMAHQDGRSSMAMFNLLAEIKALKGSGKSIELDCIGGPLAPGRDDKGMFNRLTDIKSFHPPDWAMVYVGDAQAAYLERGDGALLGALMRPSKPWIVGISASCGTIWACGKNGRCGVMPIAQGDFMKGADLEVESEGGTSVDSALRLPAFTALRPPVSACELR